MTKLSLIAVLSIFLATTCTHAADKYWDGGGADSSWTTAANWDYDTLPAYHDRVFLDVANETILIEEGSTVEPRKILGPCNSTSGTVTLNIEGELINDSYWYMGNNTS